MTAYQVDWHSNRRLYGCIRADPPPLQEATPPKTAWVLSGGGSLGAVQVGMIAELFVEGVRPDFIVGVSACALNGAFLAHNPCTDTVTRMATLWSEITPEKP